MSNAVWVRFLASLIALPEYLKRAEIHLAGPKADLAPDLNATNRSNGDEVVLLRPDFVFNSIVNVLCLPELIAHLILVFQNSNLHNSV